MPTPAKPLTLDDHDPACSLRRAAPPVCRCTCGVRNNPPAPAVREPALKDS